jgi:hypothetical protein
VLTPEMAHVMGGREGHDFKRFERMCRDAYNILRRNGKVRLRGIRFIGRKGV